MKNKVLFLLLIVVVLLPNKIFATPLDFNGGVQNEHVYEEMVFVTGTPIKFVGTYTVSEKIQDDEETVTYKFKLTSEDLSLDGKLNRTVSYKTDLSSHGDVGQTIGQTNVSKYKETIKLGKDTYDLTDYQFSKSDVIDQRPASDFYSGNIKARKYYEYNKDEGNLVIDITGANVGYENFWGSTETQIVDHIVKSDIKATEDEKANSWQGTYSHQVSDSLTKSLRYSGNDTSFISFDGGHIKVENRSVVSKYNYSFPDARGSVSLNQEMVPNLERLIVPKFRDVNGHWAEENIKKLYSLDVFENNSDIFSPDTPANKLEFTKAIMKASDIRVELEKKKTRRSRRNKDPEVSYFKDVDIDDSDYKYVKSGVDKKIITGISKDFFEPNKSLTRSEAIVIMVRALGFENRAPNPGYVTAFSDDRHILPWAKDGIYIAREIDLVKGDSLNRVNPNKILTRAEASTLIVRFLEFLEKDLQKDYRENIINY